MTRLAIVAVVMVCVVTTAQAAPCYHANEIEADQAVRYQAKLMVLSDSCRSDSYREFITHNGEVVSSYQKQMIAFFRRQEVHSAEDQFDRFLTRVANQFALAVGQEPLASLCPRSADFLTQANSFGNDDFRHYVAEQAAIERRTYRVCTD